MSLSLKKRYIPFSISFLASRHSISQLNVTLWEQGQESWMVVRSRSWNPGRQRQEGTSLQRTNLTGHTGGGETVGRCLESSLQRTKACGGRKLRSHFGLSNELQSDLISSSLCFSSHISLPFQQGRHSLLFLVQPFYFYVRFSCFPALLHFCMCMNEQMPSFISSANILPACSWPGIVLGTLNTVMNNVDNLPILKCSFCVVRKKLKISK